MWTTLKFRAEANSSMHKLHRVTQLQFKGFDTKARISPLVSSPEYYLSVSVFLRECPLDGVVIIHIAGCRSGSSRQDRARPLGHQVIWPCPHAPLKDALCLLEVAVQVEKAPGALGDAHLLSRDYL